MTRGEELVLIALRKEHVWLKVIADKAQAKYDEYMHSHDKRGGLGSL